MKHLNDLGINILKANKKLLEYYINDEIVLDDCPLCNVVDDNLSCNKCSWFVIEDAACHMFYKQIIDYKSYPDISDARDEKPEYWINIRIPMLKKHIKIIENRKICPDIYKGVVNV